MSRRLRSAVVVIGILAAGVAHAGSQEEAAIEAANAWLALVDGGELESSWKNSSSLLRNAVTAAQWEASVRAARGAFGTLISREVLSAQFETSLPGAPDGQYVVIVYRTAFEKKQAAVETVTPMKEGGDWKVAGYYIK